MVEELDDYNADYFFEQADFFNDYHQFDEDIYYTIIQARDVLNDFVTKPAALSLAAQESVKSLEKFLRLFDKYKNGELN